MHRALSQRDLFPQIVIQFSGGPPVSPSVSLSTTGASRARMTDVIIGRSVPSRLGRQSSAQMVHVVVVGSVVELHWRPAEHWRPAWR
jgi:hypothetical protein